MNLIWSQGGTTLKDSSHNGSLIFPVGFPGLVGSTEAVVLSTSALIDSTYSPVTGIKLFLQGDPDQLDTLLNVWPNYSSLRTPAQLDVNGGLEISFDRGYSYIRLGDVPETGQRLGFPDDPTTWIDLPGAAIVPGGLDGTLGPHDSATILIRYRIPALANQFDIFDVRLEASFDVD